jgi:hypothetical protein
MAIKSDPVIRPSHGDNAALRSKVVRLLGSAVLGFAVSSAALAQGEVAAPAFNIGDTWTFDVILEQAGARKPFTETVVAIAPDRVGVQRMPRGPDAASHRR